MTRRAWAAFAAASIIWGVPYLFIKIAVDHGVTPPVLAWGRVTLGALVLLVVAWRAGTLGSVWVRWRWLLAFAVAEIAIPFPMLAIGEERVPSSLAAIMVAAVPLIGAILALRFDHSERPTPIRALGLAIGFGGVIALVGHRRRRAPRRAARDRGDHDHRDRLRDRADADQAPPRRPRPARHDGRKPRARVVDAGAVGRARPPSRTPSAGAIGAVVVLGLLCTAIGFVVYAILIGEAGHEPRHRDHVRQPGGRGHARRGAARRAPGRRCASPVCC